MNVLIALLLMAATMDGCAQKPAVRKAPTETTESKKAVEAARHKKVLEDLKWCDPKGDESDPGYAWTGETDGATTSVGVEVDGQNEWINYEDYVRAIGPGMFHKCVMDSQVPAGKKGRWVEDKEAEAKQAAEDKKEADKYAHKVALKKALTTRVLTEAELDEVLAIGTGLANYGKATSRGDVTINGVYYQGGGMNTQDTEGANAKWFAEALRIQYEIRQLKK